MAMRIPSRHSSASSSMISSLSSKNANSNRARLRLQAHSGMSAVSSSQSSVSSTVTVENDASCAKNVGEFWRDDCYSSLALKTLDPSRCSFVSTTFSANVLCYSQVASAKEDKNICNELATEDDRKYCLSSFQTDVYMKKCSSIKIIADRDTCYQQSATQSGNVAFCLMITTLDGRLQCVNLLKK